MTLPPSDSPDWTDILGSARYLGTAATTINGIYSINVPFGPASTDGAVFVVVTISPGEPTASITVRVAENSTGANFVTAGAFFGTIGPVVSPINAALGANWTATVNGQTNALVTVSMYVFAIPAYPIVHVDALQNIGLVSPITVTTGPFVAAGLYIENGTGLWTKIREPSAGAGQTEVLGPSVGPYVFDGTTFAVLRAPVADGVAATGMPGAVLMAWNGASLDRVKKAQQVAAQSLAVVIASDQAIGKSGAQTKANSAPVVLPTDQPAGSAGQAVMASSLPVVIASDQSPISEGSQKPYDSMLLSRPAAAVQATVTFPATAGKRWQLHYAGFTLRCVVATATTQLIEIVDGAAAIWQDVLSIPAVANAVDRHDIGPGMGIIGTVNTAMIVRFAAAGPANTSEDLNAMAYLVV